MSVFTYGWLNPLFWKQKMQDRKGSFPPSFFRFSFFKQVIWEGGGDGISGSISSLMCGEWETSIQIDPLNSWMLWNLLYSFLEKIMWCTVLPKLFMVVSEHLRVNYVKGFMVGWSSNLQTRKLRASPGWWVSYLSLFLWDCLFVIFSASTIIIFFQWYENW